MLECSCVLSWESASINNGFCEVNVGLKIVRAGVVSVPVREQMNTLKKSTLDFRRRKYNFLIGWMTNHQDIGNPQAT